MNGLCRRRLFMLWRNKRLGSFDIDKFASRLNSKILPYVLWRPDPRANFTNAFIMDWKTYIILGLCLFETLQFTFTYKRSCTISQQEFWWLPFGQPNHLSHIIPLKNGWTFLCGPSTTPATIGHFSSSAHSDVVHPFIRLLPSESYFKKNYQHRLADFWNPKTVAPSVKTLLDFCSARKVNWHDPPLSLVLAFFFSLHKQGLAYTTINTARSALPAIILNNATIWTLGVIALAPISWKAFTSITSCPKIPLCMAWNVNQAMSFTYPLAKTALMSSQWGKSLHVLDIIFMNQRGTFYEFAFPGVIKQTRYKVSSLLLHAYPIDQSLWICNHVAKSLERTKRLRRTETKLFISSMKPYQDGFTLKWPLWLSIMTLLNLTVYTRSSNI